MLFCYIVDEKKSSIGSWGHGVEFVSSPHVCMVFLQVLRFPPRDVHVRLIGLSALPR